MKSLASWFIYGDLDWEWVGSIARKWGPVLAGALFGAAWWIWADALVYERVAHSSSPPFKYNWPGILSTLALVLINVISRDDLLDISESGDTDTETRARLWLLLSFVLAMGAVGGSIAVLISCEQASEFVAVGVGSVAQCGFILLAALLFWSFRSERESGGYGFI